MWERAADVAGVPRFTLMGILGGLAARGESHSRVWELLEVDHPASTWLPADFYPDALPAIDRLRARGLRVTAVGNTPAQTEELLKDHVEVLGSSERWGVAKPAPEFFERIVSATGLPADELAYVGDRVDNDVEPALAAGMTAVHLRRGPWGYLHEPPLEAIRIKTLEELPEALGV
jgi:HAD superfamily hydrolase (TIGR01509 family)